MWADELPYGNRNKMGFVNLDHVAWMRVVEVQLVEGTTHKLLAFIPMGDGAPETLILCSGTEKTCRELARRLIEEHDS